MRIDCACKTCKTQKPARKTPYFYFELAGGALQPYKDICFLTTSV